MGKIYEIKINDFSKGMHNDPRIGDFGYAQLIKNFDSHTYPKKLVPLRDSESGDLASTTSKKQNFCVALGRDVSANSVPYALFGLGVVNGDTKAEILYKKIDNQVDADALGGADWTAPSGTVNYRSTDVAWFELFVYYKKTGIIYGALGSSATVGTKLFGFYPNATTAFDNDIITTNGGTPFTFSKLAQGLVHSKDDILYIPYDNKIAKNNNGTWVNAALTLPTHFYITSICEYGNYLAIACAPLSGIGKSVAYLWDRDATLATLSESIDWGEGNLKVLEEIEGHLIGISSMGIDITTGASNQLYGELIIRTYSGGTVNVLKRFISTGNSVKLLIAKQKVNHFLYFLCSNLALNGTGHVGLWKIGRVSSDTPFALTFNRSPSNDDSVANVALKNFFIIGDYAFISYVNPTDFALTKTSESSTGFGSTSATYESLIFGDSKQNKKLISVWVNHEALAATGSVILKYKLNAETSYTTILTNTTANSFFKEATNIESSGANLPQFREISFQILNTTGTPITGLGFKYEEIMDGLTN